MQELTLERASAAAFSLPGRYWMLKLYSDNSSRQRVIFSCLILETLWLSKRKLTDFWSVTIVKNGTDRRRCLHFRQHSTIAQASRSTIDWFFSDLESQRDKKATGLPCWRRVPQSAFSEASISTVRGVLISGAVTAALTSESLLSRLIVWIASFGRHVCLTM